MAFGVRPPELFDSTTDSDEKNDREAPGVARLMQLQLKSKPKPVATSGDAPLDLTSRYNHEYFCRVVGVSLDNCIVTVRFHAHGDNSLGPLQGATDSKLRLGHNVAGRQRHRSVFEALPIGTTPEATVLHTASDRECTGELRFKVDDRHTQGPFSFAFGSSGYSWVDIPAAAFVAAGDPASQENSAADACPVKTRETPVRSMGLRALFTAMLYHADSVADAIVCASHLKHHPLLSHSQDLPPTLAALLKIWSTLEDKVLNEPGLAARDRQMATVGMLLIQTVPLYQRERQAQDAAARAQQEATMPESVELTPSPSDPIASLRPGHAADDFAVTALSPRQPAEPSADAEDRSELKRASTAPQVAAVARRQHSEHVDDERPLKKTTSGLRALKDELVGPSPTHSIRAAAEPDSEPVQAGTVHVHLGGRVPSCLTELVNQGPTFQQCFDCVTRLDLDASALQKAALQSVRLLKSRMEALGLIDRMFGLGGDETFHYALYLIMDLVRSPQLQEAHFASGLWLHSGAKEQLRAAFHSVLAVVIDSVDKFSSSAGSGGGVSCGFDVASATSLEEVICRCGLRVFGECHFQPTDQHWLQEVSLLSVLGRLQRSVQDQTPMPSPRSPQSEVPVAPAAVTEGMVVREAIPLESLDITVSSNQGMVGSLSDDSTETFWESSQDDRSASISFSLPADASASLHAVWIFVDNQRDDRSV